MCEIKNYPFELASVIMRPIIFPIRVYKLHCNCYPVIINFSNLTFLLCLYSVKLDSLILKTNFYWPYIVNINHFSAAPGIQNLSSSEVTYTVMVLLISPFTHSLFIMAQSSFDPQLFSHSWIVWLIGTWTKLLKVFRICFWSRKMGWLFLPIYFLPIYSKIKEQGYICLTCFCSCSLSAI